MAVLLNASQTEYFLAGDVDDTTYNWGGKNGSWGGWFFFNDLSVQRPLLTRWFSSNQQVLLRFNGGNWQGYIYTNATYGGNFTGGGIDAPATGSWFHVVLVLDNGILRLYVNGVPAGTTYDASAGNLDQLQTADKLAIGFYPGASPFDGILAEIAIGNKALSASEILQWYSGGAIVHRMPLSVFGANLKGYWSFAHLTHGASITTNVPDESLFGKGAVPVNTPTGQAAAISVLGAAPLIVQAPAVVSVLSLLRANKRGYKHLTKIGNKI